MRYCSHAKLLSVAVVILVVGVVTITQLKGQPPVVDVYKQLQSAKPAEREAGVNAIMWQRKAQIGEIERIVKENIHNDKKMGMVKTSIILLGDLHAEEAIPLLVRYMNYQVFYAATRAQPISDGFPCVGALIKIGLPSVDPAINNTIAGKNNDFQYYLTDYMLISLLGKPVAFTYIGERIKNEKDGAKKAKLKYLLKKLGDAYTTG